MEAVSKRHRRRPRLLRHDLHGPIGTMEKGERCRMRIWEVDAAHKSAYSDCVQHLRHLWRAPFVADFAVQARHNLQVKGVLRNYFRYHVEGALFKCFDSGYRDDRIKSPTLFSGI